MAGAMIDWNRGLFYDTKRGEVDRGQLITRDIDTAPEGFCFVRKDVFEKAGFFDPRFFFYYEGGDWTTRIKKKGFRIVCLPSAKIWHKVGFSLGNESARFYYYRTRNRLLFMSTSALRISLFIFTFYFLYDFFYRTLITLFWSGQRKQIIAALDGLFDFLRGRFGYKAINE
jgi:GT2 family glycosyltransferase